jgi:hypothetical protein
MDTKAGIQEAAKVLNSAICELLCADVDMKTSEAILCSNAYLMSQIEKLEVAKCISEWIPWIQRRTI